LLWLKRQGPNSLNRLLGQWWMSIWTQHYQKLLGRRLVYKLEVLIVSKDPRCKRHPNTWRKEESKEIKDSMKVEDGCVHHKKYNGCCTKQWVIIQKTTLTSPVLGKWFTCRTSFSRASLMKDDVKGLFLVTCTNRWQG